jgi:hypothetical protein
MDLETINQLYQALAEPLAKVLGNHFREGSFRPMEKRGLVADEALKIIFLSPKGKPTAFILYSSPRSPDLVARSMRRARQAKQLLGNDLGRVILSPLAEGEIKGLSYAILPYCNPLSNWAPIWRFQRLILRPALFKWLLEVTKHTVAGVEQAQAEEQFLQPLRRLVTLESISESIRAAANNAIKRLTAGTWKPRTVLMHGDLWKGNVLIGVTGSMGLKWKNRFAIIDWASSLPEGYAFFDLVRLAQSMNLRGRGFMKEVRMHCRLLDCEPSDAAGHLLSALGYLAESLEYFPLKRFAQMAELCFEFLRNISV